MFIIPVPVPYLIIFLYGKFIPGKLVHKVTRGLTDAININNIYIFFSFQLFLLPHEMCLHHPGGFLLYIYINVQYCTALNCFFLVFCHENKVWYWVHFDIPPPPEVLETATFGILSISMPVSWYLLTWVRYLPSVTPPSQWVRILSIHYGIEEGLI